MPANVSNTIKSFTRRIIHNKQTLIKILSIAVILALALILKISNNNNDEIHIEDADFTSDNAEYFIDIGGAVENPGVYKVKPGTRLFQVVELAGGLQKDADINSVNQAAFVEDGAKVVIPRAVDNTGDTAQSKGPSLININTADKSQLCTLPGIGDVIADRIIEYRSSNRFTKIEDLKSVKGIGNSIYEEIKQNITV